MPMEEKMEIAKMKGKVMVISKAKDKGLLKKCGKFSGLLENEK
jgi:hypothetical protein